VIGYIGFVAHHLGSLPGAIELAVLCAFACIVRYLMLKLGKLYSTNMRFDLLASLGSCN
jgi:hypothetical protein